MRDKRLIWVDLLRIFATWGVISIHGKSCYDFTIGTLKWYEYNLIGFAFTFCVPVFLMLSGYLSLQRKISIKDTLQKRFFKVSLMKITSMLLCVIAGILYAVVSSGSILDTVSVALRDWGFGTSYLAVLAGCYLVTPFLYSITDNRKVEEYFLILAIVFCFIIPSFTDIEYVRNALPSYVISVMDWIDAGEAYIPVGSVALYVLGHYLGVISENISKKMATVILVISFMVWVCPSIFQSANPGSYSIFSILRYGRYYGGYVSPLITLYAAGVFLFFKNVLVDIQISEKWKNG